MTRCDSPANSCYHATSRKGPADTLNELENIRERRAISGSWLTPRHEHETSSYFERRPQRFLIQDLAEMASLDLLPSLRRTRACHEQGVEIGHEVDRSMIVVDRPEGDEETAVSGLPESSLKPQDSLAAQDLAVACLAGREHGEPGVAEI